MTFFTLALGIQTRPLRQLVCRFLSTCFYCGLCWVMARHAQTLRPLVQILHNSVAKILLFKFLFWILSLNKLRWLMRRISNNFFKCVVVFLPLLFCCFKNAERDNPLDPASDQFTNVGTISGRAFTFYSPFQPLAGVEIKLPAPGIFLRSDANGEFLISDLPAGAYDLIASKAGYQPDSTRVEVTFGKTANVEFHLDGIPVVEKLSVVSGKINRWFPTDPLWLIEIEARVTDPDGVGDISEVIYAVPSIDLTDTLSATTTLGLYRKSLRETELVGQSFQNFIGRDIFVSVDDRAGASIQSQAIRLARIVEVVPVASEPIGLSTISITRPLLVWRQMSLPFPFSYRLELFRNDSGITTEIWKTEGLASADTTARVEPVLSGGLYFWTVSVVDEFGNWSRSKEAAFQVR